MGTCAVNREVTHLGPMGPSKNCHYMTLSRRGKKNQKLGRQKVITNLEVTTVKGSGPWHPAATSGYSILTMTYNRAGTCAVNREVTHLGPTRPGQGQRGAALTGRINM